MKITLLLLILLFGISGINAQDVSKKSVSLSLVKLEKNSETFTRPHHVKFVPGLAYQIWSDRWRFGCKFELGYNKMIEDCTSCSDSYTGVGSMREANGYISLDYAILQIFKSRFELRAGLGNYASVLNYSGRFTRGFTGTSIERNTTYTTIGLSGSLSAVVHITDHFFLELNGGIRLGESIRYDTPDTSQRITRALTASVSSRTFPELVIGLKF